MVSRALALAAAAAAAAVLAAPAAAQDLPGADAGSTDDLEDLARQTGRTLTNLPIYTTVDADLRENQFVLSEDCIAAHSDEVAALSADVECEPFALITRMRAESALGLIRDINRLKASFFSLAPSRLCESSCTDPYLEFLNSVLDTGCFNLSDDWYDHYVANFEWTKALLTQTCEKDAASGEYCVDLVGEQLVDCTGEDPPPPPHDHGDHGGHEEEAAVPVCVKLCDPVRGNTTCGACNGVAMAAACPAAMCEAVCTGPRHEYFRENIGGANTYTNYTDIGDFKCYNETDYRKTYHYAKFAEQYALAIGCEGSHQMGDMFMAGATHNACGDGGEAAEDATDACVGGIIVAGTCHGGISSPPPPNKHMSLRRLFSEEAGALSQACVDVLESVPENCLATSWGLSTLTTPPLSAEVVASLEKRGISNPAASFERESSPATAAASTTPMAAIGAVAGAAALLARA